jgi:hypothetical protein
VALRPNHLRPVAGGHLLPYERLSVST